MEQFPTVKIQWQVLGQDGNFNGILNSPHMDTPYLQLHTEQFPLKNPKLAEWIFHPGQMRKQQQQHIEAGKRGWDKNLIINPNPNVVTHS